MDMNRGGGPRPIGRERSPRTPTHRIPPRTPENRTAGCYVNRLHPGQSPALRELRARRQTSSCSSRSPAARRSRGSSATSSSCSPRTTRSPPRTSSARASPGASRTSTRTRATSTGWSAAWSPAAVNARNLRTYRAEVVPWLWFLTRTPTAGSSRTRRRPTSSRRSSRTSASPTSQLDLTRHLPHAGVLRPVPRDRLQLRLAADGARGDLLLLPARGRQAHAGPGRRRRAPTPTAPRARSSYSPRVAGRRTTSTRWEHQYEFRSGKWTRTDYNFETPSTNLLTTHEHGDRPARTPPSIESSTIPATTSTKARRRPP